MVQDIQYSCFLIVEKSWCNFISTASDECGKFMFTIFFSRRERQFFKKIRLTSKFFTKKLFSILSICGSLCIIFFQFLVFDFLDLAKVYAQYRTSNNFIYLILEAEFGNNICFFCTS